MQIILAFFLMFSGPRLLFSQKKGVVLIHKQNVDTVGKSDAISTFNMFREPSYILFGSGFGNLEPLMFEGDLVPYFMVSLSRNVRWGVEFSPRVLLRMYNQFSHPVRTPSFMPKITFFYQFIYKEKGKRDLFAYFSLLHHSNGQDGSFYNVDSTLINTKTGSFSTNWVEGGLFLSRPNAKVKINNNYVKIYTLYNYSNEKELDGIYGRLRLFVNIKSEVKLSSFFKILLAPKDDDQKYVFNQSMKIGWIVGMLNDARTIDKHRFIFNYTLSFKPKFLKDANFFMQYYFGQDYYNIYFGKQLNVVRFGIASSSDLIF